MSCLQLKLYISKISCPDWEMYFVKLMRLDNLPRFTGNDPHFTFLGSWLCFTWDWHTVKMIQTTNPMRSGRILWWFCTLHAFGSSFGQNEECYTLKQLPVLRHREDRHGTSWITHHVALRLEHKERCTLMIVLLPSSWKELIWIPKNTLGLRSFLH